MSAKVPSDSPIVDDAGDLLGRGSAARRFADQVLAIDASEGLVVGVLGPWGSGKTSFVNLARDHFADAGVPVVDFNPWMFSGTEQLVDSFFIEVGAQLKLRRDLAKLGDSLQEYGAAFSGLGWLPFIGSTIERVRGAAALVAKAMQRRREGVGDRRDKLRKALEALERPIAVILDDIDRLSTTEIRDVFRLVRLTASFPNIIYVVSFDRVRVEDALTDAGTSGRAYLEKMLQLAVDLPVVPVPLLTRALTDALDAVLADVDFGSFGLDDSWPDLFYEIIRPFVRNVRDVRRYSAAVHGTARTLAGRIALGDILALEAIRVFLPDMFAAIAGGADALTSTFEFGYGSQEDPRIGSAVKAVVAAAGDDHSDLARAAVMRLFPAAVRHLDGTNYGSGRKASWLRDHRVAHEHYLGLYLERVVSEGLAAFEGAEQAFSLLGDEAALDAWLRSIDHDALEDVIGALETYEDRFTPAHAESALTVVLNLWPDIPERTRGMFGMETRMVVGRVIYRLARAVSDPVALAAVVSSVLPKLSTLNSKLELITDVGHREGAGHRLVSVEDAAAFERAWRDEVRSTPTDQLLREQRLASLLFRAISEAEDDEPPLTLDSSPEMTAALLRSAETEVLGQGMGSRAVRRTPRLQWSLLAEVVGGDDAIYERIDALAALPEPPVSEALLALALRYRGGWRPDDFGRDPEGAAETTDD